jgi:hypothetical protein
MAFKDLDEESCLQKSLAGDSCFARTIHQMFTETAVKMSLHTGHEGTGTGQVRRSRAGGILSSTPHLLREAISLHDPAPLHTSALAVQGAMSCGSGVSCRDLQSMAYTP